MAARQAKISSGRPLLLATAAIAAEPVDGLGSPAGAVPLTLPQHMMSPRTRTGMKTTGIVIGLSAGLGMAAPVVATGFKLILWIANPVGWVWFRTTPVFLYDRDASVTYDINAFPLYLQIDATSVLTPGNIEFHMMEM